MTPLELARDECANYNQGACLGVSPDSLYQRPGHRPSAQPLEHCLIHVGQRCPYFERVVLPMEKHGSTAIIQAREMYTRVHGLVGIAPASRCPCGAPRAPRKRFCAECAGRRRQTTLRDAKRRERGHDPRKSGSGVNS